MARMAVSALEGAELNVEMTGRGPALVALHGFTGSVQTWRSFSETAGTGFTVVAVDLPGHGASDSPQDFRLYTMGRHVEALAEIIDRLGLERVAWLGYSLGGRIALSAAVALPERTTALVLESASPGIASEEERQQRIGEDETLADWIEEVGVAAVCGVLGVTAALAQPGTPAPGCPRRFEVAAPAQRPLWAGQQPQGSGYRRSTASPRPA